MHLRRALLLMALVLGVAAVVEALVPVPRQRSAAPPSQPVVTPAPTDTGGTTRTVGFRYPPAAEPPVRRLPVGTHVILVVSSAETGQVSLEGLGQVQAVEPGTPAGFDLLMSGAGRYAVAFQPEAARAVRLGSLVVSGSGRRP